MNTILRGTLMSLGLVAALAAGFASSPAKADSYNSGRTYYGHQPYGYQAPHVAWRAPVLGERQIDFRLQRQGYRQVGPLTYARGVVLTRAIDPRGRHVRLTVSASTGQVLGAQYRW